MNITCIWNGHNTLGEGPLWDYREQTLYWIDIEEKHLHCLKPDTATHIRWDLPSRPGCIGLNKSGGLIAALEKGFVHIDLPSAKIIPLDTPLAQRNDQRFNDGKCDRQGRFWAGTIDLAEQFPIGGLYKLERNMTAVLMDSGFTVSNGIGWSLDNTLMYFTDSPARKIYVYDFDVKTGNIANRRIFAQITEDAGYPDGLTVDNQGYLWSCHWDGWRITRYAPNGSIDKVINMPVQRPTCCCFGGKDFKVLYVTSASRDLTVGDLAKGPLAGGLFAITCDYKGLAEPLFG